MVPSETTSTTARKCCLVCITNFLNQQDVYMGETRYAPVERNCVLFYLIIVFREESQARFELLSEIL